jgi:hypothetical protein
MQAMLKIINSAWILYFIWMRLKISEDGWIPWNI